MQLIEIIGDLDEQFKYFIMDYAAAEIEESMAVDMVDRLCNLKEPHNLEVAEILGYEAVSATQIEEKAAAPRGYRLLVLRAGLPMNIAKNVVQGFGSMARICSADVDALKTVEGIGVKRANQIIESIRMMRNH